MTYSSGFTPNLWGARCLSQEIHCDIAILNQYRDISIKTKSIRYRNRYQISIAIFDKIVVPLKLTYYSVGISTHNLCNSRADVFTTSVPSRLYNLNPFSLQLLHNADHTKDKEYNLGNSSDPPKWMHLLIQIISIDQWEPQGN